jgi:sugar phosphate isomerase/epimerase
MQIALNTYSLRKEWGALTAGENYLPIVKFIKMLEGVSQVELLDRSFNSDPKILAKIKEVFSSHGIQIFSLGPHVCPLVGKDHRPKALAELKHWVDVAADHDVHNFRLSLGGGKHYEKKKWLFIPRGEIKPSSNAEAVEWALEVLGPAVDYGKERGVTHCIETHHRYSSNPDFQDKLLTALPSANLGFIFDIGNFENRDLSWKSLEVLIKHKAIKYMHAKTYSFDENGFETTCDYPKAIKQMYNAGIRINASIEWEGKMPTFHGILHTYELCKYSIAKAQNQNYAMNLQWDSNELIMQNLMLN